MMLKENGKLKTVYVIAGIIVLLLTIGNSAFNWFYSKKSDSISIVTLQSNQETFQSVQLEIVRMLTEYKSDFDNYVEVDGLKLDAVKVEINGLKSKDMNITKLQNTQSETTNEQTKAITKLTVQVTYMKEAITKLENTK